MGGWLLSCQPETVPLGFGLVPATTPSPFVLKAFQLVSGPTVCRAHPPSCYSKCFLIWAITSSADTFSYDQAGKEILKDNIDIYSMIIEKALKIL